MNYDRFLVLKLIPTTKLAIWLESRKLTLVPHMVLKLVISEGHFAECALELLGIEPRHHNPVDLVIEALHRGAERALGLAHNIGTVPPSGQALAALQSVALFALTRPLDDIVADATAEFSFQRFLNGHVWSKDELRCDLLDLGAKGQDPRLQVLLTHYKGLLLILRAQRGAKDLHIF